MIERGDGRDRAHRFALGEYFARFTMRCQIATEDLTIILNGGLTGQHKHIIRTPGFIKRMLLANAQFQGKPMRDAIAAFTDQFGRAKQNFLALIPR